MDALILPGAIILAGFVAGFLVKDRGTRKRRIFARRGSPFGYR